MDRGIETAALLERLVTALRLGMEGRAQSDLAEFMTRLLPWIEAHAAALGEAEAALLNTMMAAQERGDLLLIADLLEYDLPASKLAGVLGG